MINESNSVDGTIMFLWMTPMEILLITFSVISLISSVVFISIILSRKEFRENLSLILTLNLSIGGLVSSPSSISNGVYMLKNVGADNLCSIRGYFWMSGTLYILQATALQTIHRLFVTVFVHHRQWQNRRLFVFIASVQLSSCLLMPLPLLLNGNLPYISVAKLCYIVFNDLVGIVYPATTFYLVPLTTQF